MTGMHSSFNAKCVGSFTLNNSTMLYAKKTQIQSQTSSSTTVGGPIAAIFFNTFNRRRGPYSKSLLNYTNSPQAATTLLSCDIYPWQPPSPAAAPAETDTREMMSVRVLHTDTVKKAGQPRLQYIICKKVNKLVYKKSTTVWTIVDQ